MIFIESKRSSLSNLRRKYPEAVLCDVTSGANDSLKKLSPFYPHLNIPIPYSSELYSASVEGIWQGLKVFPSSDVNMGSFCNTSMKNIKRTTKKNGIPIGHRQGVNGKQILGYLDARLKIYLPSYLWVLENKTLSIISRMRDTQKDLVLLDYTTNQDITDLSKPLSHAYLIKCYIEHKYPISNYYNDYLIALEKYNEIKKSILDLDYYYYPYNITEFAWEVTRDRPMSSREIIKYANASIKNSNTLTSRIKKSCLFEVFANKKPMQFSPLKKY